MKPKINEGDFWKVINSAIKEGRHVDYLEKVKKDYEKYSKFFESIFTEKNPKEGIYIFKVTYLLKKNVWREFEILGNFTFTDLAEAIIESMNWDNDHMHGFEIPDHDPKADRRFPSPYEFYHEDFEDDPHPYFKTCQIKICDIDYKKVPKMEFMFDYGDGHRFDVEFKGVREVKDSSKWNEFPVLVDQRGVAPEQYPMWDEEEDDE